MFVGYECITLFSLNSSELEVTTLKGDERTHKLCCDDCSEASGIIPKLDDLEETVTQLTLEYEAERIPKKVTSSWSVKKDLLM